MGALAEQVKRVTPRGSRELAKRGLRQVGLTTAGFRPAPEFLVVGTKRGGTTSLWNYLVSHPAVLTMFPAAQHYKSPHYFYWHHARGPRWYRSHFATTARRALVARRTGQVPVAGEASPFYLYHPLVPGRVAAELPGVKVVVMLRNPVRRAYSHYWERVDQGVEPLSFADALAAEPERLAGEWERSLAEPDYYSRALDWYSYRDRGIYAPQLERWFDAVPREDVLVVASEDFYRDPTEVVGTVTDFLGLRRAPLDVATRHNHRPAPPLDPAVAAELAEFYRPYNERLYRLLDRDLGW